MATLTCGVRLRHWASRLHFRHEETPDMKRMREVFEMHEFGVAAYRQRMRREHPQATDAEIDAMVRAWLLEPPPDSYLRQPPKQRRDDDSS